MEDYTNKRQRTRLAVSGVVSNPDIVALILADSIGPSTFAIASLVCKVWLSVCRTNEAVLRGVALYQGGLTKSIFTKLFAVAPREADVLPRTTHKRYGGGTYFLYGEDAVNVVLAAGGLHEWRRRLRLRAQDTRSIQWQSPPQQHSLPCRRALQREERLHKQASQRSAWKQLRAGYSGPGCLANPPCV